MTKEKEIHKEKALFHRNKAFNDLSYTVYLLEEANDKSDEINRIAD